MANIAPIYIPKRGVTHFYVNFGSNHIFGMDEAKHFKSGELTDTEQC